MAWYERVQSDDLTPPPVRRPRPARELPSLVGARVRVYGGGRWYWVVAVSEPIAVEDGIMVIGTSGRPSKSLNLDQARALLDACRDAPLGAYVTLGLLIGARNEELRALTWDHVDLEGVPDEIPPAPPSIRVWRSVRASGDTKTRPSRRTLGLPAHAVGALQAHRARMLEAGQFQQTGLVFCTDDGTALDSANVRRMFRNICSEAVSRQGSGRPGSCGTRSCR